MTLLRYVRAQHNQVIIKSILANSASVVLSYAMYREVQFKYYLGLF